MADSSIVRVVNGDGTVKSFIFWSSEDSTLQIQNASDKISSLTDSGSTEQQIYDALKNDTEAYLCLNPAGGRIGIGTKTPGYTLDVNGDLAITGSLVLQKITDVGSSDYFVQPGSTSVAASFAGSIGIGTKAPTEKIHIKTVNDLTVDPNVINNPLIRIDQFQKTKATDGTISEAIVNSYSIGISSSKFSILDNVKNDVALSISSTDIIINRNLSMTELTVDKIVVNQLATSTTKLITKDFETTGLTIIPTLTSTDIATENLEITGVATIPLISTSEITTLTSTNAIISNKLTVKDLEISGTLTTTKKFISYTEGTILPSTGDAGDEFYDTVMMKLYKYINGSWQVIKG